LILAVAPMLLVCFPTFVTAPMAIVLGVMSYFKPNSILGFSRFKALAAIVLALFQIVLLVLVLMGVFEPFLT
jgi:Co/Zn/Cd efflux system component